MAVAEVALRRRAGGHDRAARRPAARRRCRSTWMPCTIVVRGERKPVRCEQLDRRAAVLGPALLQLARLLVRVDVADEAVLVGVGGDLAQPVGRHGAHAVGGDADRVAGEPQRVHAREVVRRPTASRKRAWPAAVVGGGQQDDPQPGGGRRLGDGERHRVRLLVRRAVGPVVDVVELADGAVAGGAPSRRRRGRATSRIESGSSAPASRYIASRQLQKSSSGRSLRSPTPRRSRWNACECTFGIAGIATAASRELLRGCAAARSPRPPRRRARPPPRGEWLTPRLVAHEHHRRRAARGDDAGVVAGVADESRRAGRSPRRGRRAPRPGTRCPATTRRSAARARRRPPRPPAPSRPRPPRATTRPPPRAPARRATAAPARGPSSARWARPRSASR